ncbi:MAG: DUF2232 domain-containing protein [Peptoniphilus sp.]|nr:DUF2232 domain-containing protein [Peptoniphilus sp.]MDY3118756.1 DUF2232 domain-containing protein [Peptoniphilus sp.]
MYRKIYGLRVLKLLLYSILLVMGGLFVPILFAFIPAMFLSEMRLQGVLPIFGVFVGSCILIGLLTDPILGLSLLTVMGPLILILDYCMRTDRSVETTMAVGTLLFLVSFGFILYRTGALQAIQSGELLKSFNAIQGEMVQKAMLTDMEKSRIVLSLKTMMGRAMTLLPSFFLLSGLGVVYLSYRISGRNMRIAGEKVICPGPFFLTHLPRGIVLLSVGFLGAAFAGNYFLSLGIDLYVSNGLVIVVSLLSFQGMSVVNFYLLRYVPSAAFRGIIMLFILMVPVGQMGLASLGLLDQFIDVRGIEGV